MEKRKAQKKELTLLQAVERLHNAPLPNAPTIGKVVDDETLQRTYRSAAPAVYAIGYLP